MACERHNPVPVGQPVLEVEQLSFAYADKQILHDVSLVVRAGDLCGLLGPNGSGKTTLFKCCLNFLRASSGAIRVLGKDLSTYTPGHLAQHVAYVPQEHQLAFPFLVKEVVAMGRSPHLGWVPVLSREDWEVVEHTMERVDISHLAAQPYNKLSGGQRQLVLVARALAQSASLLFLDEPTSALDFNNQLTVWEALLPIAAEGVGIVLCCHDPNHILWFCDTMLALKEGRVVAGGAVRSTMNESLLHSLYGRSVSIAGDGEHPFIVVRSR